MPELLARWPLPEGYELRQVTAYEEPRFGELVQALLVRPSPAVLPEQLLSPEALRSRGALQAALAGARRIRLAVYQGAHLVGWSSARQLGDDLLHMSSSAVVPEHRRRGLYAAMVERMCALARAQGFSRVTSNHLATNNPVLIAKLQRGFVVTGLELTDSVGLTVQLTWFAEPRRRHLLEVRAGAARPDAALQALLD